MNMKHKSLLIGLVLLLLAGGGCMMGVASAAKKVNSGLAEVVKAAAANTNAFQLDFSGFGVNLKYQHNMLHNVVPESATGIVVEPVTTLRTRPVK